MDYNCIEDIHEKTIVMAEYNEVYESFMKELEKAKVGLPEWLDLNEIIYCLRIHNDCDIVHCWKREICGHFLDIERMIENFNPIQLQFFREVCNKAIEAIKNKKKEITRNINERAKWVLLTLTIWSEDPETFSFKCPKCFEEYTLNNFTRETGAINTYCERCGQPLVLYWDKENIKDHTR